MVFKLGIYYIYAGKFDAVECSMKAFAVSTICVISMRSAGRPDLPPNDSLRSCLGRMSGDFHREIIPPDVLA